MYNIYLCDQIQQCICSVFCTDLKKTELVMPAIPSTPGRWERQRLQAWGSSCTKSSPLQHVGTKSLLKTGKSTVTIHKRMCDSCKQSWHLRKTTERVMMFCSSALTPYIPQSTFSNDRFAADRRRDRIQLLLLTCQNLWHHWSPGSLDWDGKCCHISAEDPCSCGWEWDSVSQFKWGKTRMCNDCHLWSLSDIHTHVNYHSSYSSWSCPDEFSSSSICIAFILTHLTSNLSKVLQCIFLLCIFFALYIVNIVIPRKWTQDLEGFVSKIHSFQ